jgi:Putative serine esterase (DUF676)
LWCALHTALADINKHIKGGLRAEFRERLGHRYYKQIIGKKIIDPELGPYNNHDSATEHRNIARSKRNTEFGRSLLEFDPFEIELESTIIEADNLPIVFEESFIRIDEEIHQKIKTIATNHTQALKIDKQAHLIPGLHQGPHSMDHSINVTSTSFSDPWSTAMISPSTTLTLSSPISNSSRQAHLSIMRSASDSESLKSRFVFLSHGFQGSAHDCLKLKHYFALQRPDVYFHNVKCNAQEKTTQNIGHLGEMFAVEVRTVLRDFLKKDVIETISFIGHSLGGLIIRAALPLLREEFGKWFQAYMTLSTPHLGVGSGDSFLVGAGFNLMTSWKKFDSLLQMGMKDAEQPKQTFLYQLSTKPGLESFREVILISSPQDTYSPYDSSRIQSSKTNSGAPIYFEMVENLMNKIRADSLKRVDVCMKFEKASLDRFIGRAAHIALIANGKLIELLSYRYARAL